MIMETERLRLRELTPEDLDALYAVFGGLFLYEAG